MFLNGMRMFIIKGKLLFNKIHPPRQIFIPALESHGGDDFFLTKQEKEKVQIISTTSERLIILHGPLLHFTCLELLVHFLRHTLAGIKGVL